MLNQKYPSGNQTRFFLFHRPRRWNAGEALWMGYERKRGKLTEFTALLRGGSRKCFSEIVGETAVLPAVKYVITLDTDTQEHTSELQSPCNLVCRLLLEK